MKPSLPDDFVRSFSTTLPEFRPHTMWFWNAPLEEAEIHRQVHEFHIAGIHDFYIHPLFGFPVDYLSEEMMRAVGWAVDEARALGMRFWIYDEYNWPSGVAGGYVIRDHPEHRALILVRREWEPGEEPAELPGPVVALYERDGRTIAFCEVAQGGLCPSAQWSPFCWEQEGYADLCDAETVRAFLDRTLNAYRTHFADDFGQTLAGVFTDEASYCLAGAYGRSDSPIAWSHGFRDAFRSEYGYDIADHLASLLEDVGDFRRVRVDYWRLMSQRLESAYYAQYAARCRELGIRLTGHLSGEELFRYALLFFGDFHRCIRWMDVPGIDCIFPRQYHESDHFMVAAKSGSSAARFAGSRRLLSETYTGSGWDLTPAEMKLIFDKLALGGVNLLQYMGAYYSIAGMRKALPGGYPPSHSFQNAYWPHYRQFGDYVARVCHALAASQSTARVAVLYPITSAYAEWAGSAEDLWSGRPGPPRFERLQQTFLAVTNTLLELSVDYDYLFEDVLAEADVADASIRVQNADYDVLVVPAATCLSANVATKLAACLRGGVRVVFVGGLPEWVSGDGSALTDLAAELGLGRLGSHSPADGPPYAAPPDGTVRETLAEAIPAQYRALPALPDGVRATRRELDGEPLVFMVNQGEPPQQVELPDEVNAVLDPETGDVRAAQGAAELGPRQSLIATRVREMPLAGAAEGLRHERVLGDAEFETLAPNLWAARWKVRTGSQGEWFELDGHRLPQGRVLLAGEPFELRWDFTLAEDVGDLELVVEDLGEPLEVSVNGHPVHGLTRCRMWDWLNLSAPVSPLVRRGENEVRVHTRAPDWRGPHVPPMLAVRGAFAVLGDSLVRPPRALPPGSWPELGFPHYVGTARYRWEVDLGQPEGMIVAEADDIAVVGEMVVNGHRLTPRLWRPYRFDITEYIRQGGNVLELEVTSSSANLLGWNDPARIPNGQPTTMRAEPAPAGLLTPLRVRW